MKKNKKLLALVCCMALLVGAAGTTIAWFIDQTETISNTFTVGDINIELDEAKTDEYGNFIKTVDGKEVTTTVLAEADRIPTDAINGNSYKMIPGFEYTKDPTVKVLANSEACWLFVKVVETGGKVTVDGSNTAFSDLLSYEVDTSEGKWTPLTGFEGVYYIKVSSADAKAGKSFTVLKDNSVTINYTVTKQMLNALTEKDYPLLSFEAYAIQLYETNGVEFDVEAAWDEISE